MTVTLKSAVHRRVVNLIERSKLWNESPPNESEIYDKVEQCFLDGFSCCYCGRKLQITEPVPSVSVFSLDHYIPFAIGGYNKISNIVICCHSCNIIKGTMTGDTYKKLLKYIPPELISEMFVEIWKGRLADKIERETNEKNQALQF